jgi:amidophosphoribosyltransferase
MIGADSLGYLRLEDVREIAEFANPEEFCTACFDGNYPTETPIDRAKNRYEINR